MAKVYFITGASRGLGLGLVQHLLQSGHHVLGLSRQAPDSAKLPASGTFDFLPLDISMGKSGAAQLREFIHTSGVDSLDTVILNAGILGEMRDMRETSLSDLRHLLEVNLWANKWILDTLFDLDLNIAQVVAISSGASVSGSRGWNGYSISKAALNMMIKLYAGELPDTHFTALAPGLIHTEMQDFLHNLPEDDRFPTLERLKQAKGTPEMPGPETTAELLLSSFPSLIKHPSGSFLDIRKLNP